MDFAQMTEAGGRRSVIGRGGGMGETVEGAGAGMAKDVARIKLAAGPYGSGHAQGQGQGRGRSRGVRRQGQEQARERQGGWKRSGKQRSARSAAGRCMRRVRQAMGGGGAGV